MKHFTFQAQLGALSMLAGMIAPAALAAPFCLTNQVIPPQCIYYDAQQCQRDAQKQNAECSVNAGEVHLSTGYGKYCMVTSEGASNCNFTDQGSCAREANRQHGTCAVGPGNHPFQAPDPYSGVNGD